MKIAITTVVFLSLCHSYSMINTSYCPIKAVIYIASEQKPHYLHCTLTEKHTFALCLISEPAYVEPIYLPDNINHTPNTFMLKIISPLGTEIKHPPLGNDIIGFLGVMGASRQETEEKAILYSQQVVVTTR